MEQFSPTARAYIAAVIATGAIVIATELPACRWEDPARFVFFLSISLLASLLKVRLPGVTGTMSVYFLFLLVCVAQLPAGETVLIGAASTTLQCYWHTRRRPALFQVLFNVANTSIASVIAFHAYHWSGLATQQLENVIRLSLAAIAFFVFNTGPVSVVIAITENRRFREVWQDCYLWCFPYYLLGAALADLFGFLSRWIGWQTSLMMVPVVYVIHRSYHLYLSKLESEKNHAETMAALHLRTIEALALAMNAKDQIAHEHLGRVQVYALELAKALKLSKLETDALQAASILYDIGKLAVPEHIISKPGKLTPEEFEKMKIHPIVGAEILERVEFPYPVVPIVAGHHEKWDGTGYPLGLKGEEIPIGARILAVVDCLDALASDRQYRRALPLDEALNMVVSMSNTAFDPQVVEILQREYKKWEDRVRSKAKVNERAKPSTYRRVERAGAPAVGLPLPHGPSAFSSAAGHTWPEFLTAIAAARQEVQTLYELAQDLGRSLSLKDTLSMLSTRLMGIVPYDGMAIYLVQDQMLSPKLAVGEDHQLFGSLEIPLGKGLSGWVADSRKPVLNGNPSLEPGHLGAPARSSRLNSALAVPLEAGHGVIGVVALYRTEQDAFSRDELRILLAVSSKLAVAIENAFKFETVENSATKDFLTGLPNARSLFMHLHGELSRAQREGRTVAVLVCDLDGFKSVNDRYGHLTGNELLKRIAQALRDNCREYDYVARMGGDEFVIVLPGIGREQSAGRIAELDRLVCQQGRELCPDEIVGLSVGDAYFPEDGTDAEALLLAADQRMYKNKAARKEARTGAASLQSLAAQWGDRTEAPAGSEDTARARSGN
jgi:diguanylate cyclase (GGDEF)-like protein/putative nucleotidyltransferase with HDIG domain